MLAAATSFFSRTNISQNYNIGQSSSTSSALSSRSGTPTPGSSSTLPTPITAPPFLVGPWRVQPATHKTTNKRVSVWSFDKRMPEMEKMGPVGKERTLEVLKSEATSLSRLRHPCILEVVEPLEETRSELVFATEPLLSLLLLSIPNSSQRSPIVELDEVEIQKGILQLCKGLSFLHTSARLIHSNISPESILINSAGDWKIGGLGLTIALVQQNGTPTKWEFPTFDGRVMSYIQRSFDYMAPEYALDEVLNTASDMYSLGCLVYAVHCKGDPPFKNHGSLGGLRENAGRALVGVDRLDRDLQAMLISLITRHSQSRLTPTTLPTHSFFSSLPISTLNFLDRSNFAAKTREEKVSFMKGLTSVLDKFSEGLRVRKILPSLLEEMKDSQLLPTILPNVFVIAHVLSPTQFAALVLPNLKPLFVVKDPPQNMITLLDNLKILQEKTEKPVFLEHVMPLVYNALDSEHSVVQERALKVVPDLCDTIDYAEVQGVLFPRVAMVFTKTKVLSVKIATLTTFLTMVKTLDQGILTQKLVPLLSKIRTKEPAVMMATLNVQEEMGAKVDREAVAIAILPQLWQMAMGPLLNVDQFQKYMTVIKKLGDRVQREHDQFLRDSQRTEDRSAFATNEAATPNFGEAVSFENLVGRADGASVKPDMVIDGNKGWDDDDPWASIFSSAEAPSTPSLSPPPSAPQTVSLPSSPRVPPNFTEPSRTNGARLANRGLGSIHVQSSSFNTAVFGASTPKPPIGINKSPIAPPIQPNYTGGSSQSKPSTSLFTSPSIMQPLQPNTPPMAPPIQPNYTGGSSQPIASKSLFMSPSLMQALQPNTTSGFSQPRQAPKSQFAAPNYNISLPTMSPTPMSSFPLIPSAPTTSPPPFFNGGTGVMAPSKPLQPTWGNSTNKSSKDDWADFDPLA